MEKINFKLPTTLSYNKNDKPITTWKDFRGFERDLYKSRGYIVKSRAHRYFEKTKKSLKKGMSEISYPQYKNELFDPWQDKLSKYIHEGSNVIVDVKTSCGKTWAVNQIVTYETLMTDNKKALSIIPNQSVLFDSVKDITENHKKNYKKNNPIVHFSTKKWASFEKNNVINSQILCLTVDTVLYYLDIRYESFFKKIKYFVFDEIHLDSVSSIMWKLALMKIDAQFILLSATLGDVADLSKTLKEYRPETPINIIKYDIRPIPLQYLVFKNNVELCDKGLNILKSELDNPFAFSCQINFNDPTIRDIKKMLVTLKIDKKIPSLRQEQYYFGQEIVGLFKESPEYITYQEDINTQIANATKKWSTENLLSLLQNLFARDMAPVLIFNSDASQCVEIVKKLGSYLFKKESEDVDVKKTLKEISRMEKKIKRNRDKEPEFKQDAKNYGDAQKREKTKIIIPSMNNKWRFPHIDDIKLRGKHIPEWIKLALEYGIGIHIESMNYWLKKQMFDLFRDKKIRILVADIGLSVGVNLPARSVIMTGEINPILYQQMGGRAGRRGLDNMGYIIPLTNNIEELITHTPDKSFVTHPKPFGFIDIIHFCKNHNNKTSMRYNIMKNYFRDLDKDQQNIFMEKYSWLSKTGLLHSKWAELLIEINVDQFVIFITLLNDGVFHYLCHSEISSDDRNMNLMIMLAYLLDPGLKEIDCDDSETEKYLPEMPYFVNERVEYINQSYSETNKILDISCYYDNYLLKFYKKGEYTMKNIKKIGEFQKVFFKLLKIFKHMVETKYYEMTKNDLLYETLKSLDSSLWAKCHSIRGVASGL